MRKMRNFKLLRWVTLLAMLVWTASAVAQEATNRNPSPGPEALPQASSPSSLVTSAATESVSDSVRELREQVRELQAAVAEMRSDWQHARQETAEMRRELAEIRAEEIPAGTGSPNAVLKNAVAKLESGTSESAGNLQSALPNGAIQDQREIQKGDQKSRPCRQPGRGIRTAKRKSGRSISDKSGKRLQVSCATVGNRSDEPVQQ